MSDIVQQARELAQEPIINDREGRSLLRKMADEIDRMRIEMQRDAERLAEEREETADALLISKEWKRKADNRADEIERLRKDLRGITDALEKAGISWSL